MAFRCVQFDGNNYVAARIDSECYKVDSFLITDFKFAAHRNKANVMSKYADNLVSLSSRLGTPSEKIENMKVQELSTHKAMAQVSTRWR
jgi:hypothetical protein